MPSGGANWELLPDTRTETIKDAATRRFKSELGYKHVYAWPIFEREDGQGSVMYYMIHASGDVRAPKLMARAYANALGVPEPPEQLDLEFPAEL